MTKYRLAAACGLAIAARAAGQCENPVWQLRFLSPETGLAGTSGIARPAQCLQVFDPDGPGPLPEELYVGGSFLTAGGVSSPMLAKWNGSTWSSVGGPLLGNVGAGIQAMTVHDFDGPGPALPVLVIAGAVTGAGGVPVDRVAAWNGTAWSAVGTPPFWFRVVALSSIDLDGSGPNPARLIVGAEGMEDVGTSDFRPFATWDGSTWTLAPSGNYGNHAMAVFDEDGPGPLLESVFIGQSDTPGIVKWDQTNWSIPGGGLGNRSMPWMCTALRVVDEDGPGPGLPVLLAGGNFNVAGGQPAANIARWNGIEWSSMGTGFPDSDVTDILSVANPSQPTRPHIYAVGIARMARWDQSSWRAFATYAPSSVFPPYPCLASFQSSVYVGGPGVALYGLAQLSCECYANCDGSTSSPRLNSNDFICFVKRFAASDPYANCDGSTGTPALTANDFQCFLTQFVISCN